MKVYIYTRPGGMGYTVMSGRPWPQGRVERVTETLWGARRVAKRLAKQTPPNEADRKLVEVVHG